MKKLLILVGMLWSVSANAQFTPGQILTAAELNAQFSLYAPLAGASFTGGVSGTTFSGAFTGPHNGSVGAVTPSTGVFTNLTATGTVTLPSGFFPLSGLATQAANTVVANATGSTASPTAKTVPSCSAATNALQWVSGTGFACNSSINASNLGTAVSSTATGLTAAASSAAIAINDTSGGNIAGVNYYNSGTITWGAGTSPGNWVLARFVSGSFTDDPISVNLSSGLVTIADGLVSNGTITPSQTAGIVGTTTNNNANTGSIGEYQAVTGTGTGMTTGSYVDLATVSLTAGDWDVECSVQYANSGATITAVHAGVNTVSNTNPNTVPGLGQVITGLSSTSVEYLTTPQVRESLASTTTLRCGGQVNFTSGTVTATGFIRARRVR